MQSLVELKRALEKGYTLIWNDPEPIEGNDYTVSEVFGMDELEACAEYDPSLSGTPIDIHYGDGSEAGVYLSELEAKELYWVGYALSKDRSRVLTICYTMSEMEASVKELKEFDYKYTIFTDIDRANDWLGVKTW